MFIHITVLFVLTQVPTLYQDLSRELQLAAVKWNLWNARISHCRVMSRFIHYIRIQYIETMKENKMTPGHQENQALNQDKSA